MPRKPPPQERALILARDHRRRYGSRLSFRVLHSQHIGAVGNATLLFADGSFATIKQRSPNSWELGIPHDLTLEAYATAAEAEAAGMRAAQALLLTAIGLNFGIRLEYSNHQPPTVYDRTASGGVGFAATAVVSWPETVIAQQLTTDFEEPLRDRRTLLSMELLASSSLEANDRASFIMAVSALEPLAVTADLGADVSAFVDRTLADLRGDSAIPGDLRASLEGRVAQMKRESIRQSLGRLCEKWFPSDVDARKYIDYVYRLRSEILHEGTVEDLDILLAQETRKVTQYLRMIYEQDFKRQFRAPTAV